MFKKLYVFLTFAFYLLYMVNKTKAATIKLEKNILDSEGVIQMNIEGFEEYEKQLKLRVNTDKTAFFHSKINDEWLVNSKIWSSMPFIEDIDKIKIFVDTSENLQFELLDSLSGEIINSETIRIFGKKEVNSFIENLNINGYLRFSREAEGKKVYEESSSEDTLGIETKVTSKKLEAITLSNRQTLGYSLMFISATGAGFYFTKNDKILV